MNKLRTLRDLVSLFAKGDRIRFVLLLVGILLMGLMEIAGIISVVPFLALIANDQAIESSRLLQTVYDTLGFQSYNAFLVFLGLAVIVVMVVSNSFITGMTLYLQRYGNHQNHKLCVRLLHHYVRKDYAFFLSRNASEFISDILEEVNAIVSGLLTPSLGLLSGFITAASILTVLFVASPGLTLAALVILGIAFGVAFLVSHKSVRWLGVRRRILNRSKQESLLEIFGGIKDIKISGRESFFLERFAEPSLAIAQEKTRRQTFALLPSALIQTLANTGLIIVGIYVVTFYHRDMGRIIPTLGVFAFATMRMLPALQSIYGHVVNLKYNSHAFTMLKGELLAATDEETHPPQAPQPIEEMLLQNRIELRNVSFRYEGAKTPLFENLSITIPAFSTMGIVGSTGAGKSTLIDLISGLLKPESGEIVIDDVHLTRDNMRQWQAALGYVPQHIYLSDDTISKNIAFGISADQIDDAMIEKAARIANIHDFVVTDTPNGYDTFVGDRGVRLSGGQRQRVGIARALYHNPQLLILDEATSAVDNVTEKLVMEAIEKAATERTVIIIAHRLSTVKNCDAIFYMEQGRLKESGTYDDLMEVSSGFRALVEATTREDGKLL